MSKAICVECHHAESFHIGETGNCVHSSYGENPEDSMRILQCHCDGFVAAEVEPEGECKHDWGFGSTCRLCGVEWNVVAAPKEAKRLSDEWAAWAFAGVTRWTRFSECDPNHNLKPWEDLDFEEKKRWCNAASIAPTCAPATEAEENNDATT